MKMAVIGFSFLKFNCERNTVKKGGSIEINHNISLSNVEETSVNMGAGKMPVLKVFFTFEVKYGEDLGKISVEGDLIYSDTKEIIEESFKGWKADGKLNSQINEQIFKFIYSKTIIKALELSDSLGLPAPIPLPKVNFSKKNNS